jgi:hypothetical protein
MKNYITIILFSSLLNATSLCAENDSLIYTNHIFNKNIKTVLLYKEGWKLSYPVITIGTTEKLLLQFDVLGDRSDNFYYSFIHCNKDWKRSDIYVPDYLEGFEENQLENYKPSFNTTINYYHYELTFPNSDINFKVSGNYILIIYRFGEPDNPVLTRRFMITENGPDIDAIVHRSQVPEGYDSKQQVDFTVNYGGIALNDPYRDIYSFILQNGRWDNSKKNLKPDFVGNNRLTYNSLSEKNIFAGGNEYRYFDIKSIRYQSEFIRKIDFVGSAYHVFLYPSDDREFKPYFFNPDLNGKYYVSVQEGRTPETDADYLYAYFTIAAINLTGKENIYVFGALNDWAFDDSNKMTYNPDNRTFECTLLLKQGWYNYEYICLKPGQAAGEPTLFEGSHYETENDYLILVYYRNQRDRYDRLMASMTVNSVNRDNN